MKIFFALGILLLLGGCKTVKNDIPPEQIAMKCEARERQAAELLEAARISEAKGAWREACKYYQAVAKRFLETDVAPKAFYEWGRGLAERRRYEEAFEKFSFVTKNYVDYADYEAVVRAEFEVACCLMEQYQQTKARSKVLAFFKDPKSAIDCFQSVVKYSPRSADAPKALLYIAELQLADREPTKAIETLDQLIETYGDWEEIHEAYLLQADVYLSMVRRPENDPEPARRAIDCYENFIMLFGRRTDLAEAIEDAKEGLAEAQELYATGRLLFGDFFYLRRHYPDGAAPFYREVRLAAPNSEVAQVAEARLEAIRNDVPTPTNWADKLWGSVIYRPSEVQE